MNEIIDDVKFKMLWNAPVRVVVAERHASFVHGPEDALYFLSVRWPCERGVYYVRAREKCFAAISHRTTMDAAREAFVMACLNAHLVRDDGYSQ
ncbi:DUF982 domain-containing protein [Rhizobium sp. RCC_161_2]|uniref:DUF982 domain-containing protein n=1 Tax=Rhizobium sp. RCC_161_2 TaxID=3239219 RepID=UPI00352406F2